MNIIEIEQSYKIKKKLYQIEPKYLFLLFYFFNNIFSCIFKKKIEIKDLCFINEF
jgi:hypothetical protein